MANCSHDFERRRNMRKISKQYLAEFLGTGMLVFFGCGTAMLLGCVYMMGCGYLLTALAFGVVMTVCVYLFGDISGCHINPAVTFAMYLEGKISKNKAICYTVCQCVGGFFGIALLGVIFSFGVLPDQTASFASNGLGGVGGNPYVGLIVEIILSSVFVGVVLKVTDKNSTLGNMNGIVIGLALMMVHILGIGFTGTSVNPARSIATALEALFYGNAYPMRYLWVFVLGPLVGASIAVEIRKKFNEAPRKNVRNCESNEEECEKSEDDEDDDAPWNHLVPVPRLIEKETEQNPKSNESGQNFEAKSEKAENPVGKSKSQESDRAKPEDADIIVQQDNEDSQKAQNNETE